MEHFRSGELLGLKNYLYGLFFLFKENPRIRDDYFIKTTFAILISMPIYQIESRLIHIYHKLNNNDILEQPNLIASNNNNNDNSRLAFQIKPSTSIANSLLNSSSSNIDARSILAQALQGAQSSTATATTTSSLSNQELNDLRPTIEFRSPMKRIMDLIGHTHQPPVIVVSDSSPSSNPGAAAAAAAAAASGSLLSSIGISTGGRGAQSASSLTTNDDRNLQASSQQVADQQQQQQQQHWTIVDTNQQFGILPIPQQQLLTQQQQLIQSTVPINMALDSAAAGQQQQQQQYFTFTPSGQIGATPDPIMGQQFAIFQANPNGATPFGLPQLISTSNNPYQQQQLVQSNQNSQQQASSDQQQQTAQPVFLSSYVPEMPATVQAMSPLSFATNNPNILQPNGNLNQASLAFQQQQQQKPNSIQSQIKAPSDSESNKLNTDTGDDSDNNGETNDKQSASDEQADEKRQNGGDQEGGSDDSEQQQQAPGSGSMSYEDKYDSDANEHHQPSSRSTKFKAEPSGQVINGLVNVGLNDDCLQCICRAASGCDHLLRCITRGAEEKYCGPFQLTEEYWQKAGSPGDQANNFISYEDCANDADCAVETVTNYMKKYFRDCDGDDNITCMDYARLHRLKPNECDQTDKLHNDYDAYWAKFQRCAEGYNRTRNGDDEDI